MNMKNKLFQSFVKKPKKQQEELVKSPSFFQRTKKRCVECQNSGDLVCKTCNVIFCDDCYGFIHPKEEKEHETTTINENNLKSLSKRRRKRSDSCKECNAECTIFCSGCNEFFCQICYKGLHNDENGTHLACPLLKCSECQTNTQNHCSKCSKSFCKVCYNKFHEKKDEEHSFLEFNTNVCSVCNGGRDFYCKNCQVSFCKFCSQSVHELETRKNHNLIETKACNECSEVSNIYCPECNHFYCDYCSSILHTITIDHHVLFFNKTQYLKQVAVLRKSAVVVENNSKSEICYECSKEATCFCETCTNCFCKECFEIIHTINTKKDHTSLSLGSKCKNCGNFAREFCKECNQDLCTSCSYFIHLLKKNKTHEKALIRPKQNQKKKDPESCNECNLKASILCLECKDIFCEECAPIIHQLSTKKDHSLQKIEDCSECEERSKTFCSFCKTFYCKNCSLIIHSLERRKDHLTLNWYGDDYTLDQQHDFHENILLLINKLKKPETETSLTDSEDETLLSDTTTKLDLTIPLEKVLKEFSQNSKSFQYNPTTYFWIETKKNPYYIDLKEHPSFPPLYSKLFSEKVNIIYSIEERKEKNSSFMEKSLVKKVSMNLFGFNSPNPNTPTPLSPRSGIQKEEKIESKIAPFYNAVAINITDEFGKKGPETFKESDTILGRRESFNIAPLADINRKFLPFDKESLYLITPKEVLIQENVSCSLFFYDLTKEVKLTEDFPFLFQHKSKECIFSISTNSTIYIVLIFEKLLYFSEEFGWIKQPLMFGYHELNHKEKLMDHVKIKTFYKFPEKKFSISSLIKGKGFKPYEIKGSVSFHLSLLDEKYWDFFEKENLRKTISDNHQFLKDLTKPSQRLLIYSSFFPKNVFFFEVGFKNKDDLNPPNVSERCFVKNFYYEVNIQLPLLYSEKDHIYFKFYDNDQKVVGYSFFPLLEENLFQKGTRAVNIYTQLVNNYLTNKSKLENTKNVFEFNYNNLSNFYPLFKDTSLSKISSLPKENVNGSIFIILTYLLDKLTTSIDDTLPVLLNVFKITSKELLEDFIQFFYQPNEEIPLFYVLPEILIQSLSKHSKDILYFSNFFFDLTIKSILLQENLFLFDIFLQSVTNLITKFCKIIIEEDDIVGNRNLSFFIRDMISIFSTNPKVSTWIEEYSLRMKYSKPHLKLEFIQIMLDEKFISLLKDKSIIASIIPVIVDGISKEKFNQLFYSHLKKISKKIDPSELSRYYSLYFELIIEKNHQLYSVQTDEDLYLILNSFCFLLTNKNEKDLIVWWQNQSVKVSIVIFKLFRASLYLFCQKDPKESVNLFKICNLFYSLNLFINNDELIEEISLFYLQALRLGSFEFISIAFDSMFKFMNIYMKDLSKPTIRLSNAWKYITGATLSYTIGLNIPDIVMKCLDFLTLSFKGKFKEIDIKYDQDIINDQKNNLKAASIGKLIEILFVETVAVEKNYESTFLITYFSFVSNEELLEHVLSLYKKNRSDVKFCIRLYNFIASWIKSEYFPLSIAIYSKFIELLNDELLISKFLTTQGKIKKILITKLTSVQNRPPILYENISKEIKRNTDKFDILEWNPYEIAKQLTLIEMQLFKQIQLKECFGLAWSKKNKEELAPNIVAITERFNKMSSWIEYCILREKDLKIRTSILSKFIQVLKFCRDLNNFTTVNQIVAALRSASVYRLKKTFEGIKEDDKKALETISSLFELPPYTELKNTLQKLGGHPSVPFIGVYLTDLTFIEEGNPNEIKNNNKTFINFFKRRLFSETLKDIQLFQQNSYKFASNETLNDLLTIEIFKGLPYWNNSQSYEQSVLLEPKK